MVTCSPTKSFNLSEAANEMWLLVQHPTGFGEPATGHSEIPLEKQRERHPEQAPGGTDVTSWDVGTMGALQGLPAFVAWPSR